MDTHGQKIDFGKHNGELWTRVPVSYLKWMVSEGGMSEERKAIARAEMERRGTVTPAVEVSGHAIDRASLWCRKIWHETRQPDEGIYSWLCRMTADALVHGTRLESGKIRYAGMKFVIKVDGDWPVLVTIAGRKKRRQEVL